MGLRTNKAEPNSKLGLLSTTLKLITLISLPVLSFTNYCNSLIPETFSSSVSSSPGLNKHGTDTVMLCIKAKLIHI